METKKSNLSSVSIKQFKSYYVVWKRIQKIIAENPGIMFKSYYVVWKLVEKDDCTRGKNNV